MNHNIYAITLIALAAIFAFVLGQDEIQGLPECAVCYGNPVNYSIFY